MVIYNEEDKTIVSTNCTNCLNIISVVLLAVVLVLGAVCLWQRREIRRKKHLLAQFIMEGVEYKWKYHDASYRYMLARLNAGHGSGEPGEPTAEAAAHDSGSNDE